MPSPNWNSFLNWADLSLFLSPVALIFWKKRKELELKKGGVKKDLREGFKKEIEKDLFKITGQLVPIPSWSFGTQHDAEISFTHHSQMVAHLFSFTILAARQHLPNINCVFGNTTEYFPFSSYFYNKSQSMGLKYWKISFFNKLFGLKDGVAIMKKRFR